MNTVKCIIHVSSRPDLIRICKDFGISIEVGTIGDKEGNLQVEASVIDIMQAMTFGYIVGGLDAVRNKPAATIPVKSSIIRGNA